MTTELDGIAKAISRGNYDEAIVAIDVLTDRGVVGSGISYNRGLAYALRAESSLAQPGDFGRAVHGFEETLRLDPHDSSAKTGLDEVRKQIAKKAASIGIRETELGLEPLSRAIATALPADVWLGLALTASVCATLALGARPWLRRGARLAASTVILLGGVGVLLFGMFGLAARYIHTHVREAVVVVPRTTALPDVSSPTSPALDLIEGTRVDILEERATTTRIETTRGQGWVARDAIRPLPRYRP